MPYNPFTQTNDRPRIGNIWLGNQQTWKPDNSPFLGAGSGSLESDALGYGSTGDTAATKDYAWRRWVNNYSPFLTQKQLQDLEYQRSQYESALQDAYRTNPNARFGDVLGGADVIRNLMERQGPQRYLSTRYREN